MDNLLENIIESLIAEGIITQDYVDSKVKEHEEKQKDNPLSPKNLDKNIVLLADENASLIFQNVMQDMNIQSLQDENAELMFKIAMIEMGGNV